MNKYELTKSIIEQANLDIDVDDAYKTWWFADVDDDLYRLKLIGYKALLPLTPSFRFETDMRMTGKNLLKLSKLNCAYFINYVSTKTEIYIFSTKIATTIKLYGSFDKYIKTLN